MLATADRITPHEAHAHLEAGARLVCAYDNDQKFQQNRLEGAMSLADLRKQEASFPKDQELIFYCA